jgi:probable HAF family extracellular repeat protein
MRKTAAAIALALAFAPAAVAAPYSVTAVAAAPSSAYDINKANQVVGAMGSPSHAFLYSSRRTIDLGTLGGGSSIAYAINDNGVVAGGADTASGVHHAFTWTSGAMKDLGTTGSWSASEGHAINLKGYVVGDLWNPGISNSAGFLWNGATMTQLPNLGGPWMEFALAINRSGMVVGSASTANGWMHAFSYAASTGVVTDLGTLPGDPQSTAYGINDAGVAVGTSDNGGSHRPVMWSNGQITALPPLVAGAASEADDVNYAGVIVGTSNGRAVLWNNGVVVDLNTQIPSNSGWTLTQASAINNSGYIVGIGFHNGAQQAFMLSPDTTPPTISCGAADGLWHASDVSIACTAYDSGSGLANPADASFTLSTSVPAGTETANALTGTRTVCDNNGNCATAGPIGGNEVDREPPTITVSVPGTYATYEFLSQQPASYTCSDGGSGVASCSGSVANGSPIDTTRVGLNAFGVVATDAAGNSAQTTVIYDVVSTDWPQFHNTPDHLGLQPTETVLGPSSVGGLRVAWAARTGGAVDSAPVVANGRAYATSGDGSLYAVSAATGQQLWAANVGADGFETPAVDGGLAFVGSPNGNVYALDVQSGSVIWTFHASGAVYAPPVVSGGVVYVGGWDSNLYALDEATGTLLWRQYVDAPVRSSAAVANGVVYLGTDNLRAFDAGTGMPLWQSAIPSSSWSADAPPVVLNGTVFIGTDSGLLYAVDATNGNVLWSAATNRTITGAPAVTAHEVYVGSIDGSLYAFDEATGAPIWKTNLGSWIWSSPAFANGVVYVGSSGAEIAAVDAATGTLLWTQAVPVGYSSPAVADGTVYAGAEDGNIYAFRR